MLTLRKSDLTLWLEQPITRIFMDALRSKREKDNSSFVKGVKLNEEQYVIERNLYRLAGQQQLIDKMLDKDKLKETFLSNINWLEE